MSGVSSTRSTCAPVRISKFSIFMATGKMQTCGEALAKCSQPKLEQNPQYTQALMCRPSEFT
ncbi:hypothetical protein D3C78_1911600 [compost metagenome]